MWLCKSSDYAAMIMVFLSDHTDRVVSSTEIAKQLTITQPMVMKLLKQLARARLLVAERGNDGGYCLARAAELITLADIICAVEEDLALMECASQHSACQLESRCHLRLNWLVINQVILTVLRRINLCDMQHPLSLSDLLQGNTTDLCCVSENKKEEPA